MSETPKWLKRKVRARMAETGEKYTQALRRIQEEWAANPQTCTCNARDVTTIKHLKPCPMATD